MSAALVWLNGRHLVIRIPGYTWKYEPLVQQFHEEPESWLFHMREKSWWTPEHERALVRVLGDEWFQKASRRCRQ